MMVMSTYKSFFFCILLTIMIGAGAINVCFAEVVNSIVARVNNQIITFRDLKIEYDINRKLGEMGEGVDEGRLLWLMIDDLLLLSEIQKVRQKELKNSSQEKLENDLERFKGTFDKKAYEEFLIEHEIDENDIYDRFKNKALIADFLESKIEFKKKGLSESENVVLDGEERTQFSDSIKNYILELRNKSDIIINIEDKKLERKQ